MLSLFNSQSKTAPVITPETPPADVLKHAVAGAFTSIMDNLHKQDAAAEQEKAKRLEEQRAVEKARADILARDQERARAEIREVKSSVEAASGSFASNQSSISNIADLKANIAASKLDLPPTIFASPVELALVTEINSAELALRSAEIQKQQYAIVENGTLAELDQYVHGTFQINGYPQNKAVHPLTSQFTFEETAPLTVDENGKAVLMRDTRVILAHATVVHQNFGDGLEESRLDGCPAFLHAGTVVNVDPAGLRESRAEEALQLAA